MTRYGPNTPILAIFFSFEKSYFDFFEQHLKETNKFKLEKKVREELENEVLKLSHGRKKHVLIKIIG